MDDETFWKINETAAAESKSQGEDFAEEVAEKIRERLTAFPASEIVEFERISGEKLDAAYSWNLWGAAYLICGGCSDDGFLYFRAWLLSRGKAVYERALADPDSLADLAYANNDPEDFECEALLYAARNAYEAVVGSEMAPGRHGGPIAPRGENWDYNNVEFAKRLPRLDAIYT